MFRRQGLGGTKLTFLISGKNKDVDVSVKLGVCNSVHFGYVCVIPDRLSRKIPFRVIHNAS